jgi:hypothetical protein
MLFKKLYSKLAIHETFCYGTNHFFRPDRSLRAAGNWVENHRWSEPLC